MGFLKKFKNFFKRGKKDNEAKKAEASAEGKTKPQQTPQQVPQQTVAAPAVQQKNTIAGPIKREEVRQAVQKLKHDVPQLTQNIRDNNQLRNQLQAMARRNEAQRAKAMEDAKKALQTGNREIAEIFVRRALMYKNANERLSKQSGCVSKLNATLGRVATTAVKCNVIQQRAKSAEASKQR